MSELQSVEGNSLAKAGSKEEIIEALSNSLYAGAKKESVHMVLNYCQAAKLDPFMKPVHIVPMSIKNPTTNRYEFRDVVMPGINLYRIQAARSGKLAGMSEPEYGPTKKLKLSTGETIEYPEYCKFVVRRMESGHIYEFSAKEFWLENYATKGKDSKDPNAMWKKRPFGQIAKCTEAQALRKGFPELCAATTAEEMEGKTMEHFNDEVSISASKVGEVKEASRTEQAIKLLKNPVKQEGEVKSKESPQQVLTDKIIRHNIPEVTIRKWLEKAGVVSVFELDEDTAQKCIAWIEKDAK